jgi:hypothetical protein
MAGAVSRRAIGFLHLSVFHVDNGKRNVRLA